jgi:endonuclease/exonuclease/phosphatase family metal-dependent hydrolase
MGTRFLFSSCLLAVLCLLSGPLGCSSSRQAAGSRTIRVMTYNIHHGEGLDGKVDIDRIAKLILDSKADVVALQEVDRGVERTKNIDIMTYLSDLTDMTYAFGKTTDYQGGRYGNGFLTRFPIFEERNLLYGADSLRERRGLLQLVLGASGEEFVVMSTHLDNGRDHSERVSNIRELMAAAQRYTSRPIIVCGDFNETPEGRAITMMRESFTDVWETVGGGAGATYPADSVATRIDYVFVSRPYGKSDTSYQRTLRPISARVLSSRASDHLPLLTEFEFSTEK